MNRAEGELFAASVSQMKVWFSDWTYRGVIVLRPTYVFDSSAGIPAGKLLKSSAKMLPNRV